MTTAQSPSIIVLGSINTDFVVSLPRLPTPGETILGDELREFSGGKGANQAVAAARAAAGPVALLSAVGDDERGERELQSLERSGVCRDFIQRISGRITGAALIFVSVDGENMIGVAPGANARIDANYVSALPDSLFASARVFLSNLEAPLESVLLGLKRAKCFGLTTILNPAPADRRILEGGLPSLVDVLTPNETESALLTNDHDGTPAEVTQKLRALGFRHVVMTRGADGCLLATSEEASHLRAHSVKAVDTTAAGDAFNGALAAALAEGRPLANAVAWAMRAGAIAVTRMGAQPSLPTRDEIERFQANV